VPIPTRGHSPQGVPFSNWLRCARDGTADSGRSAAPQSLKRIESHADELAGLGPQAGDASLGTALVGDVVTKLLELATAWKSAPAELQAAVAA